MTNATQPKKVALLTAWRPGPLPQFRHRRTDRALHGDRARDRDHRLPRRLHRACCSGDRYRSRPEVRAAAAVLHRYGGSPIGNSRVKLTNVEGLRQARPGEGGPGSAEGRRRPARARRRRRPAHDRRRRHQHGRGGPGRLSRATTLRPHRDRPAQDGRQRRLPDPAVASAPAPPPSRARAFSPTSWRSTAPIRAC